MTSTKTQKSSQKNGHTIKEHENAQRVRLAHSALSCFQHSVKRDILFHSLFIGLAALSLVVFLFFFSFLADSYLMGIYTACFFFGIVLYFVLKIYFQEQRPQEFLQLRNNYLAQCALASGKDDPQSIYDASLEFIKLSLDRKIDYCTLPKSLDFMKPSLEKLIAFYTWKEEHHFKELFLRACIDQKVKLVKLAPTEAMGHAELATSYMALAEHFRHPPENMSISSKIARGFWDHFQTYARLSLEELLIVKEYAPNDLWVCSKLAECYLTLGMLEQAIIEYEVMLEENPNDTEALFSLGTLYFKQGLHGKGLKVYEELQDSAPQKAQELIALYGSHDSSDFRPIS